MPSYSDIGCREAVINELIHRQYTRTSSEVSVDIFDDRLEVTSPEYMYSGKTIDKEVSEFVVSERRNPVIADISARMHFMDRRAFGLKKITNSTNRLFGDNQNYVEFYSKDNFFKVVIKNANWIGETINDTQNDTQKDTQNDATHSLEKMIINEIKKNYKITKVEIARNIGKSKSTIERAIKASSKIYHEGSSKSGKCRIK